MALMMGERGAPLHDLSAWRVTIPAIASKPELDNPRKYFYSYVLDVNRLDVVEGNIKYFCTLSYFCLGIFCSYGH